MPGCVSVGMGIFADACSNIVISNTNSTVPISSTTIQETAVTNVSISYKPLC